jgi:hypothetical protein
MACVLKQAEAAAMPAIRALSSVHQSAAPAFNSISVSCATRSHSTSLAAPLPQIAVKNTAVVNRQKFLIRMFGGS